MRQYFRLKAITCTTVSYAAALLACLLLSENYLVAEDRVSVNSFAVSGQDVFSWTLQAPNGAAGTARAQQIEIGGCWRESDLKRTFARDGRGKKLAVSRVASSSGGSMLRVSSRTSLAFPITVGAQFAAPFGAKARFAKIGVRVCGDAQCSARGVKTQRISVAGPSCKKVKGGARSKLVSPSGGSVSKKGIISVGFPQGAFPAENPVQIRVTSDSAVAQSFAEFASMFRPDAKLSYEVRVNTGATPPLGQSVAVEIPIPRALQRQVPTGSQVELFVRGIQGAPGEELETFQLIPSAFNQDGTGLVANVPSAYFVRQFNANGTFEALLTLASTPGGVRTAPALARALSPRQIFQQTLICGPADQTQCMAGFISCPVTNGCHVSSPFQDARANPVTGVVQPHWGTDFSGQVGDPVVAVADGTIERSYTSTTYGETIIVRHIDGSATLYAHLSERGVQVGTPVHRGEQIGAMGSTGNSTGPHLHFEYVPNGQIIQSKERIDPFPCISSLMQQGSITVRDNGFLADDAFSVFLDGILLGSTTIGGVNTLAVNNIICGQHALSIRADIAPDDDGTYSIQLGPELEFSDSTHYRSGDLFQGESESFSILVHGN